VKGFDIVLFLPSFVGATMIALVHLLLPRLGFMHRPGNPWVPASAGVAIAYVFMDIFPHLAKSHAKLMNTAGSDWYSFLTHHVYLMALIGFGVYLGVVLLAKNFRKLRRASEITVTSAPPILHMEVASLAAYNFLIGYLLSEQSTHHAEAMVLLGLAMAIHFAGIDHVMRDHYTRLYDRFAGIIFAVAIYAGWLIGAITEIADASLLLLYAFLAGGLIVIATINELPRIQSYRQYGAFLAGCVVFSVIVLAVEYVMWIE